MEAKIEVGEHEVVYVKEGDKAEVEIDAFPDQRFPAQVVEVARNATIKNAGTEGEVTTFYVRLALTQAVPGALPGMSAQATISTDTHQDAVVVPIQAVTVRPEKDLTGTGPTLADRNAPASVVGAARKVRDPLRRCLFVIENGVARVRPVETGLASESEIEITRGLKDGEKVVEGTYRILSRELSDGKTVTEAKPGAKGAGGKG
jgi:HlyD family secretion protein